MGRAPIRAAVVMLMLLSSCTSSYEGGSGVASEVLDWPGVGNGFHEWGQGAEGFFGTSESDGQEVLEAWTWQGATLAKTTVNVPPSTDVTLLPGDRYLASVEPPPGKRDWPLKLIPFASPEAARTWENLPGWDYSDVGTSTNGAFVGLVLGEDFNNPPPDRDRDNPRHRVGILDVSTGEMRWAADLMGHGYNTIRQIAVSDDGRYVAVGGWANGVAMVDMAQEKVLWIDRPPTEVSTGYAVFAADGQTLYTAGSEGCVYRIETTTGRILGQWWATRRKGRSEYAHRASWLTVSPDGRWLAAGTGPEGHVYLWDLTVPDPEPRVLLHGGTTILMLSFSPDSTHLASVAGGKIKVWKVIENQ